MRVAVVLARIMLYYQKMVHQRELQEEKGKNHYMRSTKQEGKVVEGSPKEIADMLAEEKEN